MGKAVAQRCFAAIFWLYVTSGRDIALVDTYIIPRLIFCLEYCFIKIVKELKYIRATISLFIIVFAYKYKFLDVVLGTP